MKLLSASSALLLLVHLLLSGFAALSLDAPRRQRAAVLPGTSRLLSPSSYRYLLNQPGLCAQQRPLLLALVPVAPGDRTSRDVVRRTWGAKQQQGVDPPRDPPC